MDEAGASSRIRTATLADLDALNVLEKSVFASDQLSRRSLLYYITAPTARLLVLEQGARIVGDAIVAVRRGSAVARLYSIAVETDSAGRGLGTLLLSACEAAARETGRTTLRLEVRSDNAAAIRLYQRAGYQSFGRLEDYYEDGEAALRFDKQLGASS